MENTATSSACLMCGDRIEPTVNESDYAPSARCVLCERRMVETWHDLLEACEMAMEDARMALSGEWDRSDDGFRAQMKALGGVIAQAKGDAPVIISL